MSEAISIYDYPDLAEEARDRIKAMRIIDRSPRKTRAAKNLARTNSEGWSWQNLHKQWQAWVKSGRNPVVLLDKRHHVSLQKPKASSLPEEFITWAQSLVLSNQRKSAPAWRRIIEQWQAWQLTGDPQFAIPGYDTAPPDAGKGYPEGWSKRDLCYRKAASPKQELAIARHGTVAAKLHLPFIPSTREGARFLEYIFCDDVWHDRKVIVPGHINPVRVLQLGCLDYATAVYLNFGIRPDLPRPDGTRDRLKRRDFLFLVASILLEYGWPLDYPMHFVCERATATMSLAEAQTLYDISNGHVRVGYTSMEGQFCLAWEESKSGNPQGKGPHESWHNLFHNEMAFAPGQVGKDRDHQPASIYGSDREAVALAKASLLLNPAQRSAIQKPYPELAQAHRDTIEVIKRINARTDHALEGFDKVLEWTIPALGMPWKSEADFDALDPVLQAKVQWRPITPSPSQRLNTLSANLRVSKPHPGAMVRFYEDSHTATKIDRLQACIKVENKTGCD